MLFFFTVAPGGNNLMAICLTDFLGLATINMYYYYYYYYYYVRARGSNSQPLDPEFDTLDRSATDPPFRDKKYNQQFKSVQSKAEDIYSIYTHKNLKNWKRVYILSVIRHL